MPVPPSAGSRRPPQLVVVAGILVLEALLVTALAVLSLIELLTARPDSLAGSVALLVLAVVTAAWVAATAVGLLRRQNWSRASTITIQLLQIAIAVGCFQGLVARPELGWALLIPALVAGVLVVTPPVIRATARNTEQRE